MGKTKANPGGQKPPPANQRKAAKKPEKPRRGRLVWLGTIGTAGITVLVGVLVSVLSTQAQRVVPLPSSAQAPGAPQLEVDEVTLTAARYQGRTFAPFKIDIKLLNMGNEVAAINDAQMVIQKFVVLPQCASQGGFGPTGTYSTNMPTDPRPGQVVDIPISQLVPSNGADRFDLLLRAPLVNGPEGPNVYLYRVHLYLTYNVHTKPLDVGEVLVDLPLAPDAGEYFWNSYYAANPGIILGAVYGSNIPEYKRCVISNSYALRSILSLPSLRPAELTAILPQLRYSLSKCGDLLYGNFARLHTPSRGCAIRRSLCRSPC
jgi:hypothetical protein